MVKKYLGKLRSTAAAELEQILPHLVKDLKLLGSTETLQRFSTYQKVWRGRLPMSNEGIYLALPFNFPETDLDIFVRNKNLVGKLPHIESSGRICLNPPQTQFNPYLYLQRCQERVNKADALLARKPEEIPSKEWLEEIKSYWALKAQEDVFISLLKLQPPSRLIYSCQVGDKWYISDDDSYLNRWLDKCYGQGKKRDLSRGIFLWRNEPVTPGCFPNNSRQLENLYPEAKELLRRGDVEINERLPVLFGFLVQGEPVVLGMVLCPLESMKGFLGRHKRKTDPFWTLEKRCDVRRADAEWIAQRGGSAWVLDLSLKRVALLGCGSLGSGVAELLAKAGVGHLTLIDPELLTYDNVTRHSLGTSSVGKYKAIALKEKIERDLPHIKCEFSSEPWTKLAYMIENQDLIISTMAIWQQNILLNRASIAAALRPVIYGWLEPHAMAAHAVLIRNSHSCLECGFDSCGRPKLKATKWKGKPIRREPGCGAHYQPYGALDLLPAQRLVAELAVDTLSGLVHKNCRWSWLGSTERLKTLEGCWHPNWLEKTGNPGPGEIRIKTDWLSDPRCPACGDIC